MDEKRDVQDTIRTGSTVWHDSTAEAMRLARSTLLPSLVRPLIVQQGLVPSGVVGFVARGQRPS